MNEDVVGAAPTGGAPTSSEWLTIVLPTKVRLILDIWRYSYMWKHHYTINDWVFTLFDSRVWIRMFYSIHIHVSFCIGLLMVTQSRVNTYVLFHPYIRFILHRFTYGNTSHWIYVMYSTTYFRVTCLALGQCQRTTLHYIVKIDGDQTEGKQIEARKVCITPVTYT